MNDSILTRVIDIIAAQALRDPEGIEPETKLADLGLDSLGIVESIFALEEVFDITVPFNANDPSSGGFDLTTIASVADSIRGLVAEAA